MGKSTTTTKAAPKKAATKTTTNTVANKKLTLSRNGETFEFENTDGLSPEEFMIACEEAIDVQMASRQRFTKYKALATSLLKQATGAKSSDYEERKAEIAAFEAENPNLSKNYFDAICKADGTTTE